MKRKLKFKPFVLPVVYAFLVALLVITVTVSRNEYLSNRNYSEDENVYVSSSILDSYVPVVNLETVIIRPYSASDISIGKNFYNENDTDDEKNNSIIYYENTYMQNSGIDYVASNVFDVISILEGEVIEVKDEELLGKTITIKHDNDIISVYQGLSDILVKENDHVSQGQIIGKSGESILNKDLGNHLHFELVIQGELKDPEDYFDKKLGSLN